MIRNLNEVGVDMREDVFLALGLSISPSALAQPEHDVEWLIFPQANSNTAVEIRRAATKPEKRIGRLPGS
jgi:hypothetical protein